MEPEEEALIDFEELIRRLCLLVFLLDAGKRSEKGGSEHGFRMVVGKKKDVLT